VLDLYAGSGALGLEALSRGAASVTLVEEDPAALRVLRANAELLRLPGAHVVDDRVEDLLERSPEPRYDLALVDPPYALDVVPVLEALRPWLADDAVVALERSSRDPSPTWPQGYEPVRSRRYGAATLWYAVTC
jgi:16S rRNA (guanine966-N2)-methyltransferase